MHLRSFLFFLLFCFTKSAFTQTTLVGKWRRVDNDRKDQDTANKQLRFGDLDLRPDSSFHMEGDSTARNSNLQGWHIGDEYNGTWQTHDNNQIILWLDSNESGMFLTYLIIRLNKKELILRSVFDPKNKKANIRYLRL